MSMLKNYSREHLRQNNLIMNECHKKFMKNLFALLLIFLCLGNFTSCSSDDGSPINSGNNLIGKWYFEDPSIVGYSTNNSFTFSSDNIVIYSYWAGKGENEFDREKGEFELKNNILTMKFSEGVELKFVQRLNFISNNKVEFKEVEGSSVDAYTGIYYRVMN